MERERSPMIERIEEEKKISRREFLKKAGKVAVSVAVGVGVAEGGRRAVKKIGEATEQEMRELQELRYGGYVDLEQYRNDHPELAGEPEELAKAQEYFEKREAEKRARE